MSNGNKLAAPFQEVTRIMGGMVYEYKNHGGLTKREQFAMAAMQGILNNGIYTFADCATDAVQYADALLAELERAK